MNYCDGCAYHKRNRTTGIACVVFEDKIKGLDCYTTQAEAEEREKQIKEYERNYNANHAATDN